MKHRGERSIPDFSHKPKVPHAGAPAPEREAPKVRAPVRPSAPKPHGTSAKSGRRGQ